ncbi:hypothetical protein [Celeribacter sp.]|uniref:hypothetical protein n=1 Tax=Celeribacter sp. TaxID=1890673 RepID=UPI003A9216F1
MVMGLATLAASLALTFTVLLNSAGAPLWLCIISYPLTGAALTFGFAALFFKFKGEKDAQAPIRSAGTSGWNREIETRKNAAPRTSERRVPVQEPAEHAKVA